MKLKFHPFTHARAFRSATDFARYADEQKSQFEALAQTNGTDYEWWGKTAAANWGRAASAARADQATDASIQEIIKQVPIFPFDGALAKKLRELRALNKRAAVDEVWPFLKGQRDKTAAANLDMIQVDAHAAFQIALALETTTRSTKGHAAFDVLLSEHEARLASLLVDDQKEIEAKRDSYKEMLSTADARIGELTSVLEQNIQEWKAQWEETHNAFVEQLATETAVKLWSDRSKSHRARYQDFRNWAIGVGVCGLVVVMLWIFGGFALARRIFPTDSTAQIASYTAGSLALFTLLVWSLRVLIRSMMSEDHLSTDASARSALAHTYLALTKEKQATPEDRAIILATLFAPVSDGLVRDDGMPAFSPTAMAAQMLTNPSR